MPRMMPALLTMLLMLPGLAAAQTQMALGGLAAVTSRVKLGVACMASTPLRDALLLAYQWASFDYMCQGRSIIVACQGQREAGGGRFAEDQA